MLNATRSRRATGLILFFSDFGVPSATGTPSLGFPTLIASSPGTPLHARDLRLADGIGQPDDEEFHALKGLSPPARASLDLSASRSRCTATPPPRLPNAKIA